MIYENKIIEDLFEKYRMPLGPDFDKYKNHVYRVFLNCLLLDTDRSNEDKYAIAAVFHDIGIWTDHTIDYLSPSLRQAVIYLTDDGQQDWIEEITLMINWHHKTSRYRGAHEPTVEIFRKADWIDVSLGWLTYGANKSQVKKNRLHLPNLGFHFFLVKQVTRNFFRHPLNPLPMFRK